MELSPKSMAEAAYTSAVAQMETKNGGGGAGGMNNTQHSGENDETHNTNPLINPQMNGAGRTETDASALIKEIWKSGNKNKTDVNVESTLRLLVGEVDRFLELGLAAFGELDSTTRQLNQSKELADTKSREAQRLQTSEEQSRASLSTLLRAVETSKAEARDSSRSAQVEARLRTELNSLRDDRDKAISELSDFRRKQSLLEEEVRLTKSKLTRVMQEKNAMERDSRAAISLARSLDNNNSNDLNYYKRKVGELSDKLQASNDTIAKQSHTIAELKGAGAKTKKMRKSY